MYSDQPEDGSRARRWTTRPLRPGAALSALLGLVITLSGCGPEQVATAQPQFKAEGLVEITFTGAGDEVTAQAHAPTNRLGTQTLRTQGLAEQMGGLQLKQLTSSVFNVGTRGAGGKRYINVTFKARNADGDGTNPSQATRSNLTLVAVGVADSADDTAFRSLQTFGGGTVPAGVARTILPTHAMQFDPGLGRPRLSLGGEDLQVYTEAEVLPSNFTRGALPVPTSYADLGVTNIFPFGFVVRNPAAASGAARRSLPANPAVGQYDGRVTISVSVPLQPDDAAQTPPEGSKRDPWAFNMLFLVVQDSTTSVTQSVDEQQDGNQAVQTRASDAGATVVNVLPGSSFPTGVSAPVTSSRRICQVRTGGAASTPATATYLVNTCP